MSQKQKPSRVPPMGRGFFCSPAKGRNASERLLNARLIIAQMMQALARKLGELKVEEGWL
jgi:hypothetical protein